VSACVYVCLFFIPYVLIFLRILPWQLPSYGLIWWWRHYRCRSSHLSVFLPVCLSFCLSIFHPYVYIISRILPWRLPSYGMVWGWRH
jgi:hypothetical protein